MGSTLRKSSLPAISQCASSLSKAAASFGQVVRQLREEAELSQERLGFLAKLSRVYVGEIERGEKTPTLAAIASLATALRKPASELIAAAERRSI